MVFSIESAEPLYTVFELKLQLRVDWRELKADFIDKFGCECKVRPSLQEFVLLMLKLVLSAFVELDHLLTHFVRVALIAAILQHLLLEFIRHKCEWFWHWRGGNLPDEVVSELVLNARLLQEDRIGPHVEDSIILLAYSEVLLERAVID